MKTIRLIALLCLAAVPAGAQLTIPSDGTDGALSPAADVEIDLSQAVTGTWSDDNTANAGLGIYDPAQWAIVFKYSSINIPDGVTVTFKNHPTGAPVIWLVSGNATIDGVVDLNGKPGVFGIDALAMTEGAPGGFRGGPSGPSGAGAGLGPGGGAGNGGGAAHRTEYGNPSVLPLIGGSGGSGHGGDSSGGGGGGAILIGVANTLTLGGSITCNGGTRVDTSGGDASVGTGGSIRLIAGMIAGDGSLTCADGFGSTGGVDAGRIRIETGMFSTNIVTQPETVAVPPASPPVIFPPANAPTVRIVSVDAIAAPADPRAPLSANADLTIQNNGPVIVTIQTTNFPIEGIVELRRAPKFGNASWTTANFVSGTLAAATWTVTTTFTDGFSTLQARATAP